MKITKEQLTQIIIEETSRFHTGVPDDDWESALDTEKYPVQPGEVITDEISAKLEQAWKNTNGRKDLPRKIERQILDIAMAALEQVNMLRENKKTIKVTEEQLEQIIKEEAANILSEDDRHYSDLAAMYGGGAMKAKQTQASASPAKIFSRAFGVNIGSSPTPRDIAKDYPDLKDAQYNIRGQYLVYRKGPDLMVVNMKPMPSIRGLARLQVALKAGGYTLNSDAFIPTPEDYVGAG